MNLADLAKFARVQALVNMGGVLVHADTRESDVAIHSSARGPETILRFGRDLSPPIPDLALTESHISGTLVFGGAYHKTVVPWARVFAAHLDGAGPLEGLIVWPESVPGDCEPLIVKFLKRNGLWKGLATT